MKEFLIAFAAAALGCFVALKVNDKIQKKS